MTRTYKLLPTAVAALALSGCGGSPEVGDAVVVPPGQEAPASTPSASAETPADETAPAPEAEKAKPE